MTVDHIGEFLPDMPLFLRYIGRLSCSIFFFCAVEGFMHTRNKKTYLIRLYAMGQLMTCIDLVLPRLLPVPSKMYMGSPWPYISNNVFLEIFIMMVLVYIWDAYAKDRKKLMLGTLIFFSYQIVGNILFEKIFWYTDLMQTAIAYSVAGLHDEYFMGNTALYVDCLIPIFYLFRKREGDKDYRRPAIAFVAWWSVYAVFAVLLPTSIAQFLPFDFFGRRNAVFLDRVFKIGYQWMMIFALPFLLCYNGKKGKGWKYLFYTYYPLHIVCLYCLSGLFYRT
ncbi:MAG: conjugal transfer protein TraX [Oscillospiraceae bacterium]|nr:conjugal transfer protein TraX [Oscillospiraceae bacterium]